MKFLRYSVILSAIGLILTAVAGCAKAPVIDIHHVTALEAKALIDRNAGNPAFVILDLRTPGEFAQGHIEGAVMLDFHSPEFVQGLQRLDRSKTYLLYCRTGNRSGSTLKMIEKMGFNTIYHLKPGIVEWRARNLPLTKS